MAGLSLVQDRAIIHTSSAAAELQRGCCLRQSGCMLPLAPGTLRAGIIPSLGSNAKNNQLGTTQPAGYNTTQPSTAQAPELPDLRFSGTCDDFPPFQLGRQTPTSFPHAGDGSIALLLHQAAQHRLPPRMQLPLHQFHKVIAILEEQCTYRPGVAAHCSEQPHTGNELAQGYQ